MIYFLCSILILALSAIFFIRRKKRKDMPDEQQIYRDEMQYRIARSTEHKSYHPKD